MKVLILGLLIICSASTSRVATAQSRRPTFPASVFPFGGFELSGFDFNHIKIGIEGNTYSYTPNPGSSDSELLQSMLHFGFNTTWFNGEYTIPIINTTFRSRVESNLAFTQGMANEVYLGQYGDILDAYWIGSNHSGQYARAIEKRFFLASNWEPPVTANNLTARSDRSQTNPIDYDRNSWKTQEPTQGDPDFKLDAANGGTIPAGASNHEWYVPALGSTPANGGQVLQLRQDAGSQPLSAYWCADGWDGTTIYPGVGRDTVFNTQTHQYGPGYNSPVLYCDFIFRLSDASDNPVTNDQNIANGEGMYELSYDAYPIGSSTPITGGFVGFGRAWFNLFVNSPHPNENNNILTFQNKKYAVFRMPIYIDGSWFPGGIPAAKIVITLKATNGAADIFIRGFRIRNQLMDNLENHLHDHPADQTPYRESPVPDAFMIPVGGGANGPHQFLSGAFTQLVKNMAYPKADGTLNYYPATRISKITCGGEMHDPAGFRAIAYIDNYLARWSRSYRPTNLWLPSMHLFNWFDQNYPYYRMIYEDETGKLPPATNEEGGINFSYQWWNGSGDNGNAATGNDAVIPFPSDALDYALVKHLNSKGQSDFESFTQPITGVLDDASHGTGHFWNHYAVPPAAPVRDHTPTYDTYEIDLLNRYQHFIVDEFYPAAVSANPPNSTVSEHGKWNAFLDAIVSFNVTPNRNGLTILPGNPSTDYTSWIRSDLLPTIIQNRKNCSMNWWAGSQPNLGSQTPTPIHSNSNFPDTYHDIYRDRHDQNSSLTSNPSTPDALFNWQTVVPYNYERPVTASEMRMLAWNALSFGAKGIFLNPSGSDKGENIGLTDELLHHDYDYDIVEPLNPTYGGPNSNSLHPPMFGAWSAATIPLATCNSTTHQLDPLTGYTDHLIYSDKLAIDMGAPAGDHRTFAGAQRWIPISDCRGAGAPIDNNAKISAFIGNLPSNAAYYNTPGYYPSAYSDWAPADYSCGWTAYWQNLADNGDCKWWTEVRWPCGQFINMWPVAYRGYMERALGAATIGKDLEPIAQTLSQLDWINSIDFNLLFTTKATNSGNMAIWNATELISPIDLETIRSYKGTPASPTSLWPASSGERPVAYDNAGNVTTREPEASQSIVVDGTNYFADRDDRRFYQFGYFNLPNSRKGGTSSTPPVTHVIVVNPRSWPMKLADDHSVKMVEHSDPSNAHYLLGGIDARTFAFKIRGDVVLQGPYRSGYHVEVRNENTGLILMPGVDGYYSLPLSPGQGALLSFFPAVTIELGPPIQNLPVANNGRHIVAFEKGLLQSNFLATFAGGGLFVAAPIDTVIGPIRRIGGAPADSLMDSSLCVRNPSISCNSDRSTVGIVYTIDSCGASKDQSLVIFRLSHADHPYSYAKRDTIASVPMSLGCSAAPSISPASSGNFWIGWRNANVGGTIALVDSIGHIIAQQTINAVGLTNTKQLSVGSVLHPLSSFHGWSYAGPSIETCYVAFQAGLPGSSQIFFVKINQRLSNPSILDTSGGFCTSSGLPWCENINPQIHITQERALGIVWDGISNTGVGEIATPARSHHSVLLRRSPLGQWTNYTSFTGFSVILDPGATDSLSTLPVYSGADMFTSPMDSSWQDFSRVAWTNPVDDYVHIAHYGLYAGNPIAAWELAHLTRHSQDPVMAARTSFEGVLQPLMYRNSKHINASPDGISISSVDFPAGTSTDTATRVQTFIFHAAIGGCPPKFMGRGSEVMLLRPDTMIVLLWKNGKPYLWDSVSVPPTNRGSLSTTDGDSTLRTTNFRIVPGSVLQFGRYFRIGDFNVGDTAVAVAQLLSGGLDTLSMKFSLRNAATNVIVQSLESAQLTHQGFTQSGSLADSGRASDTLNLTLGDSVYMSFETSHTSLSTAQLSRMESFDNSVLDVVPMQMIQYDTRIDTIAKIALPPKADQAIHKSSIEVRVYPNPLKQSTHVDVINVEGLNTTIALYDVLGNKISEPYAGTPTSYQLQLEVNAAGLRSGTYFLRIVAGNNIATKRLMIVK